MTVKIISKLVKICSLIIFPMCRIVKISLFFVEIFSEQIFLSLIIYKSLRRAALTIANAPFTLCAEVHGALTSFILPGQKIFIYEEILTNKKGISNDYNSSLWSQMDNNGTN